MAFIPQNHSSLIWHTDETMPPLSEVLVLFVYQGEADDPDVGIFLTDEDGGIDECEFEDECIPDILVVAWMPMPSAYPGVRMSATFPSRN